MSKPADNPRKALGKGLAALLPARPAPVAVPDRAATPTNGPTMLPIDRIDPNPVQPRSVFQSEHLTELAQSIEANGIIQPLIVRQAGERFQLVAGERRWRAARQAGLAEVPVVVQNTSDEHLLEISLIENIQREDLNPIEVAVAFDRLHRNHNLTHEEIARRTGKDRVTITNTLRLLKLPQDIQLLVAEHRLSMGHARALLALSDPDSQRQLAEKAASQGMSVRQVERAVQNLTAEREPKTPAGDEKPADPNVKAAVEDLERALGTRVRIVEKGDQRGRIEIDYFTQEELHRLYQQLTEGRL